MKYFVTKKDVNSSCYYEFFKGKWDEKTFWSEDSIYIDDDIVFCNNIDTLITSVVPSYDPFGITEISRGQWSVIVDKAKDIGGEVNGVILEADKWAVKVFAEYDIFTILGL